MSKVTTEDQAKKIAINFVNKSQIEFGYVRRVLPPDNQHHSLKILILRLRNRRWKPSSSR